MRTPLLAAALGLSLAGCLVGDVGTPGTEGDDDGSNTGSQGSNTGSNSNNPTPKVDIAVDKTTIPTELHTNNPITVTVTGSGGFSGDVALAGSVVDTAGVAIPGWTVEFSAPTVTLAANGTGSSVATLKIPAANAGLGGMLKITGTSTATVGTNLVAIPVTVLNQVTFAVKAQTVNGVNKCVYTAESGTVANPVKLTLGTKVRFFNTGTVNLEIHADGVISHQGRAPNGLADPVTEPGSAYEQQPTGTGAATWYCHAPDTNLGANDPRILVQ